MLETRDSGDVQMTETPFMSPSSSPAQNGDTTFLPATLSPFESAPPSSPFTTHPSSSSPASPPPTPSPRHGTDSPPSSPSEGTDLHLGLDDDNGKNESVSFRNDCGYDAADDRMNEGDDDEKMDDGDDIIDVIGDDGATDSVDVRDSLKEEVTVRGVGKTDDSCDGTDKRDDGNNNNNSSSSSSDDAENNTRNSDYVHDVENNNQPMSPTPLTNFSIAAILKPEFGTRKIRVDFHTLPHQHPHPRPHHHPQPHHPRPHRPEPGSLPHHNLSFSIHGPHLHSHHHHHRQQQLLHHHQHHHQRLGSSSPVDLTVKGRNSNPGADKQKSERTMPLSTHGNKNNITTTTTNLNRKNVGGNSNNNINNNNNNSSSSHSKSEKKPSSGGSSSNNNNNPTTTADNKNLWPAWVFCTRYSDRPSSGPRSRKIKRKERTVEEKRPRTAFTNEQLSRLKREFEDCRYLTENRRRYLASELGLTEAQIKIWFQNKRAKIKKSTGVRNPLAIQLMAQGLYNHSTVTVEGGDVRAEMTDSSDDIMMS